MKVGVVCSGFKILGDFNISPFPLSTLIPFPFSSFLFIPLPGGNHFLFFNLQYWLPESIWEMQQHIYRLMVVRHPKFRCCAPSPDNRYNRCLLLLALLLLYEYFIYFYLFIGLKHTNHANKHNMSRSMYRTLTDMSKITSDSYINQFYRINYKLQNTNLKQIKSKLKLEN